MMLVSIIVPTFCEEHSLGMHYHSSMSSIESLRSMLSLDLSYEYLVVDNCSTDKTVEVALNLRSKDPAVKVLVNDQNYGPVASPFDAMMKAKGDAVLLIAADLQEPPELLEQFLPALL